MYKQYIYSEIQCAVLICEPDKGLVAMVISAQLYNGLIFKFDLNKA